MNKEKERVQVVDDILLLLDSNLPEKIKSYVNIKSKVAREFLGELFGTMILCLFAVGSGFQLKFQKTYSPGDNNVVSANLSGGFGLTLAIIFTGMNNTVKVFY